MLSVSTKSQFVKMKNMSIFNVIINKLKATVPDHKSVIIINEKM